jgi:hypothetical protein
MAAGRGQPSVLLRGEPKASTEVASQVGVSDEFVLVVSYDRSRQPCHVIWQFDTRMRVEFRAA